MNLGRIFTIAANVFREVMRDRILYIIILYTLLFAVAIRFLPQLAPLADRKILLDFGLGAMTLLSVIVAVFVGTGLINKEIEKRTVLVLIAKPIHRSEFITGKHLGLAAVLALLVAAMTGIYIGGLELGKIPYPLYSILIAAGFLILQVSLVTAAAIAFSVFTSSILATLLTFAVYLMGNFTADLLQLGRLSNNLDIARITRAIYLILPDFSRLNLQNQAVYGMQALPGKLALLTNAGYGVLYTVLLLAIAIIIFSRRQF